MNLSWYRQLVQTVPWAIVTVELPATAATGRYEWTFSYNDGGECDIAFGKVAARTR